MLAVDPANLRSCRCDAAFVCAAPTAVAHMPSRGLLCCRGTCIIQDPEIRQAGSEAGNQLGAKTTAETATETMLDDFALRAYKAALSTGRNQVPGAFHLHACTAAGS